MFFLLSQNIGTLVEFDPLCTPIEKGTRSINVISLDEKDVKVSVLMKELMPIESHHYEILLPLTPIQRSLDIRNHFSFFYTFLVLKPTFYIFKLD